MLAARGLVKLERYSGNALERRYDAALREVERANPSVLEGMERELLEGLLARDPRDRNDRYDEIRESISAIINGLQRGFADSSDARPLILAIRHNDETLTDKIIEA